MTNDQEIAALRDLLDDAIAALWPVLPSTASALQTWLDFLDMRIESDL